MQPQHCGAVPPRGTRPLPACHLTKVDSLAAAWAHVGLPGEGGDAGGWKKRGHERGKQRNISASTHGCTGPPPHLHPTPSPNVVALDRLKATTEGQAAHPALPLTFAGSLGRRSVRLPLLHLHRVLDRSRSSLPLNLRLVIDVGPGTANVHPCSGAERGCGGLGALGVSILPPAPVPPPPALLSHRATADTAAPWLRLAFS